MDALPQHRQTSFVSFQGYLPATNVSPTPPVYVSTRGLSNKLVWVDHTIELWRHRTFNSPHNTIRAEDDKKSKNKNISSPPWSSPTAADVVPLNTRIKALPISVLTRTLQRVDVSYCREKVEYQELLKPFLIFGLRREHSLPEQRVVYPHWAIKLDDKKATYYIKELRRQMLTTQEPANVEWLFHFKHHQFEEEEGDDDDEVEVEGENQEVAAGAGAGATRRRVPRGMPARFYTDFIMTSAMHGQKLTWAGVEGKDRRGEPMATMIQVEQYPPLTITLLPNGAWRMENDYVYFKQSKTLAPEQISLCL